MIKTNAFILLLLLFPAVINAQVSFIEVTTLQEMEAAQKRASDQMLMLFVDVYATWCGPCKMMDKQVYTDPAVADFMNARFVNVRLDGECEYGRQYVVEQQLEGYPSMFIFSDDGDRVSKVVGFTPAEELVASLKLTAEGYQKVKKYRARNMQGTLEAEAFADYITVVREMGNLEEADKLAGEYMEQVMDPRLSDNDIRVVAFHMDLEDTWWSTFSSDQNRLKRILGEDYLPAMEKIYNNTLIKAVEEERIDLISKMANELSPLVEDETGSWDLRSLPFIQYYYYSNRSGELIAYVDQRFSSDRKGDHRWLYGAASQITDMDQQYQTESLLKKEAEWFAACIELAEHFDYYFYQGMVLFFLKEREEAKASFLKAESLAATLEQQEMIAQVLGFVNTQ
ncbi:MAG: thioredoxin family protein [Bacteroidales bacterium]|nr:thioredoxin family protein [Bacteroidales bacterium]